MYRYIGNSKLYGYQENIVLWKIKYLNYSVLFGNFCHTSYNNNNNNNIVY